MENRTINLKRAYHLSVLHKETHEEHPSFAGTPRVVEADSREEAIESGRAKLAEMRESLASMFGLLDIIRTLKGEEPINLDDYDVFAVGVAFGADVSDPTPEEEVELMRQAIEELEREKPFIIATGPNGTFEETTRVLGAGKDAPFAVREVDKDGNVRKTEERPKMVFAGREIE